MGEDKRGFSREISAGVISSVIVLFVVGGFGYVAFKATVETTLTQMNDRIAANAQKIADNDERIRQVERERADLTATLKGMESELRAMNETLADVRQRLGKQEDRTFYNRGGGGR